MKIVVTRNRPFTVGIRPKMATALLPSKWPGDAQFYVYATYAVDPEKIEVFGRALP